MISVTTRDRGGCGPNVTDVSLLSERGEECTQPSPEIIPRRSNGYSSALPHGLVLLPFKFIIQIFILS